MIIYFLSLFAASVILSSIAFQIAVLVAIIVTALLSGVLLQCFRIARFVVYFAAIMMVFSIILGPGLGRIASFGPVTITYSALYFSLSLLLRLTSAVMSLNLLVFAVNPDASVSFMSRFGKRTAAAMLVATRLMPMLASEGDEILQSLQSRGVHIVNGKWRERIKAASHLVFPMLYTTLDRAISVGEAMEVRGFPSRWKNVRYTMKAADWSLIGQSAAIVVTSIAAAILGLGAVDYYSSISLNAGVWLLPVTVVSLPFSALGRLLVDSGKRSSVHVQYQ
ncbi:MAG: energy-coupling factor transporter transmembrane component T [Methanomassiliicoccales archaeon]